MGSCQGKGAQAGMDDNKDDLERTHSGVPLNDIKQNDRQIAKYLEVHEMKESRKKKLLLLGAGSSGKSTLFHQLYCICKEGLGLSARKDSKLKIRSNCILGIITLLKKSQELYEKDNILHKDCFIDLEEDDKLVEYVQNILNIAQIDNVDHDTVIDEMDEVTANKLCNSISYVWGLPQIKATFKKRENYSFIENMDYFFNKLDEIFNTSFNPSTDDTLRCRIRTTGLIQDSFTINNSEFTIHDVGGQRAERRKWIQLFDGVTAIIFVAALNHFAAVLFEDEHKNAMQESLALFGDCINQKWFTHTEIILFLNKNDLFIDRLKEGLTLSIAFGDKYTGPNYKPLDDPEEDEKHFEKCYQSALEFIQQEYEQHNKNPNKKIFMHTTTATNKENIESVFWDVQNIVVSGNMKFSGIV